MLKRTSESTFRPPWLDDARWQTSGSISHHDQSHSSSTDARATSTFKEHLSILGMTLSRWLSPLGSRLLAWHTRWKTSLWSSLGIHATCGVILACLMISSAEHNSAETSLKTRWNDEPRDTSIAPSQPTELITVTPVENPGGRRQEIEVATTATSQPTVRAPRMDDASEMLISLLSEEDNSSVLNNLTEEVGLSGGIPLAGDGTGNGSGSGDGDQNFFGVYAEGKKHVFVVDASRSMNHPHDSEAKTRFGRLKIELVNTISRMTPEHEFYVIFFNDHAIPMPADSLVSATKTNQLRCLEWVATARTGGRTDPRDALMMALYLNPDVIYFLTDGEFEYRVVKDVKGANKRKTPIYTFCFSDRGGEKYLKQIAEQNNGKYHYIP